MIVKGPYVVGTVSFEYLAVILTLVSAPLSEVMLMFVVPAEPSGMLMTGADGEVRSNVAAMESDAKVVVSVLSVLVLWILAR